jgi:trk system potassium uptake protein TrkA
LYIVIAGCGRLGSHLATLMSGKGHDIAIIDSDSGNFFRLENGFDGITVTGVPIDEDVLKKAGIERADVMAAVTPDDNLNIMAAQIANKVFHVKSIFVRVGDPEKEAFYKDHYGLNTLSLIMFGSDYIESMIDERSSSHSEEGVH